MQSLRIPFALAVLMTSACSVRADPDKPAPPTSVNLQRSTCFGNCPGYTVTLAPDGEVRFEGHAHVQTKQAQGHATPAQAAAIMDAVKQSGFHAMQDSYTSRNDGCEMMMSDQPGIKITVSNADGSKSVDFYQGCEGAIADAVRPKLEQLANTIDQQLDTARWIGKTVAPGAVEQAER